MLREYFHVSVGFSEYPAAAGIGSPPILRVRIGSATPIGPSTKSYCTFTGNLWFKGCEAPDRNIEIDGINIDELNDDIDPFGRPSEPPETEVLDLVDDEDDALIAQVADTVDVPVPAFILPTGTTVSQSGTIPQVSQEPLPTDSFVAGQHVTVPEWDCEIPATPRSLATNCFDDLWYEFGS